MKRLVVTTALACIALPAMAVRADSKDVDKQILGAWKLEFTTPDGVERTPVVLVGRQYTKYAAWHVGDDQIEPFTDVQLKDDTLVGTIKPQGQPDITVTLEAKQTAANQCEGIGKYKDEDGEAGSWKFTGQRVPLSSFDDVETWVLSFVTPDDEQHSPSITVFSKDSNLCAWYSGKDHELPASKLSVDGDQVEMTISAESAEAKKVNVVFRGTVDGDTVKGNAEFNVEGETGSFEFTGKRKS